ncbi:MAG: aspartate carbamoyltransferase catalytic subunit [Candidatus Eremiobacteraeota bacterium]|nr:aspartate carbamoyltransferase catalytic subunit [Candidatus Eremiobacteraeota bacterium]
MRYPSLRTRRSIIDLDDLTAAEIDYIFELTARLENEPKPARTLDGIACVNMFFEHSTRTMTSFTLAEKRLGADVITLWPKESSLAKGETIEDTAITLAAMGVRALVIRHPEPGYPRRVAMAFDGHVINAGDGGHAHPTQALLDIYTLREEFGDLHERKIAIVGDVLHSRVAHSTIKGLSELGAEVILVGPEAFLPDGFMQATNVRVERDFDATLSSVDAILLLRIQHERFDDMPVSHDQYVKDYRLDRKRLLKVRDETIVMHPGPYNRGTELDEGVLEFAGWRYAKQVMHGVFVRMAVLDFLINGQPVAH